MKEFADNNTKFNDNGEKFYTWKENTVGKGEIAHQVNFSFSHSVFKRHVLQKRKNKGLFRTELKAFLIPVLKGGP